MRQIHLRLATACLAAIAAATGAAQEEPNSSANGSLKWTPHRAAARPLDAELEKPEAVAAAPAVPSETIHKPAPSAAARPSPVAVGSQQVASRPAPPAASVSLPDQIPASAAAPQLQAVADKPASAARSGEDFAPLRKQFDPGKMVEGIGDWMANSQPNGKSSVASPSAADGPLGLGMMRTPQGQNASRPMLAQERPADLQAVSRAQAGGGMAPPFNTTAGRRTNRPERLAMDIEKVPSVMARQAEAEAVPTPSASKSSAAAGSKGPSMAGPADPMMIETTPGNMSYGFDEGYGQGQPMADEMWLGRSPAQLHVESFYDDPYACEECEDPFRWNFCHGQICGWLRQFGRPYYGWHWYRDLTASAGVTAFENEANLGLFGNFGFNEYINWSMPFWNAFGVGWQLGVRGTQTSYGSSSATLPGGDVLTSRSRNQTFVTTGFFTRAFEGRGLQGGAVYDYLHDSYFDNVDLSQIRAEVSYVWGYHEFGFWGAFNSQESTGFLKPVKGAQQANTEASTTHVYTGFYRVQFGDANELKLWGGASAIGQGYIGSTCRAPMSRSLAMEGTFAYLMPGRSETVQLGTQQNPASATFTPMAWNLAINLVYYPAGRSRRSLSSPYRPLFDVADNGTMMQTLGLVSP
jgi:hypothetical protein